MLFPKSRPSVRDVWQVVGLKGTGSDTYTVTDLFVPARYTFTREFAADRRETGPLYRFTTYQIFGAALPASRSASRERRSMPSLQMAAPRCRCWRPSRCGITPWCSRRSRWPRRNGNPPARSLMQTLEQMWDTASRGETFTMQQRAALRLAAVHAIHQAKEVVETAYHLAGGTAIFENQAFERRLRDIHAVTQQVQSQIRQLRGRRPGAARAAGHVETDLMLDVDKQSPAWRLRSGDAPDAELP